MIEAFPMGRVLVSNRIFAPKRRQLVYETANLLTRAISPLVYFKRPKG
jgi:hypothetical protein